jgi:hypothetical protein
VTKFKGIRFQFLLTFTTIAQASMLNEVTLLLEQQ